MTSHKTAPIRLATNINPLRNQAWARTLAWKEIALESLSIPHRKLLAAAAAVAGPLYRASAPAEPEAEASSLLRLADPAPDLAERARLRLERRELRRQRNIERILDLALRELPDKVSPDAVEPAWLHKFFTYAEDADDAQRQEIWARLLAAEVTAPHSVANRTLAVFAQMDDWEIEGFATCCAFSFAFESGWRFMMVDELAEKEIINYLQGNDMTQHCVELGLIAAEIDGMRCLSSRGMRIRYVAKVYELAKPKPEKADAVLAYRRYTRTGQQLSEALRPKKFYGFARNLLQSLETLRGVRLELVEDATAA